MEQNRKLECVVTDLDGSLLNKEKQVSPQDLQTIRTLKRKGIPVFIITGRAFPFARAVTHTLGYDLPACCCNGGHIYNFEREETLFCDPISRPLGIRLYHYLMDKGLPFIIYTPDKVIFRDRQMKRYQTWVERNSHVPPEDRAVLNCIDEPDFSPETTTYIKFLVTYVDEADRLAMLEELGEDAAGLSCVFSEAGMLDVNAAGVNKGKGVRELARIFGFDPANTLALGDNFNDREMLQTCGIAVATSNAEADILAIADHVTVDHCSSPITAAVNTLFPGLLEE